MKDEFDKLVKLIAEVYDGSPWYGPSVKSVLEDLKEGHAKLATGDSHSLIEIVLHMAAWKEFVTQTLSGNLEYKVTDELNFPSGSTLKKAINTLEVAQMGMLEALAGFQSEKLTKVVPGKKFRYYDLLHGIIHHDVYHAGQISLLKKKMKN